MGNRLENAKALYLEAIRDGNAEAAINKYSGDRYTQHSTPVKDGRAGFIEFFAEFHARNPIRDIEIVRSFEDGNYVFLHVVQTLNNGEFRYVTADIFDTDDEGKLVEHWDMIAELSPDSSEVTGPTELSDLDKTEANKVLVLSFMNEVLIGGDEAKRADYVSSSSYVEHSQGGLHPGYEEIHNVIGSGNMVAAMSKVSEAEAGNEHGIACIDLFRIDNGLIVEHWNVSEAITPSGTWVNSGKF